MTSIEEYYTSREDHQPWLANWGSPFHAVVLTRQCETPAVLLMKSSLPLLVTPSGKSVSHQLSVTLPSSKTANNIFPASATDSGKIWSASNFDILPLWGLFGIIKQIWNSSGVNRIKWIPSGGWFLSYFALGKKHCPSGIHFIMLPPLGRHICII